MHRFFENVMSVQKKEKKIDETCHKSKTTHCCHRCGESRRKMLKFPGLYVSSQ